MKKRSDKAVLRVLLCAILWMHAQMAFTGTTGKITGTVRGSDQVVLPGANVTVAGTVLGAVTETDGSFLILNIPPGVYALRFSMMGYKETIMENVRIRNDFTTNADVTLQTTILQSGETVTVVADKPLIQKDMTGSLTTIGGDEIANLPVQSIIQVLQLQAGVVESGGIHIRGGRSGEVAYWVDGVSTTDAFSGGAGLEVENASVSELQVISGTFNAEYGQAMSGIINIVTKEGGSKYEGQIRAYLGDYLSGDPIFSVLKSVTKGVDPVTGKSRAYGVDENPLARFNPVYNIEATAGGPIPFLKDRLSFFANGRFFSDEGYLYGRRWFLPYGVRGDGSLIPMNPTRHNSGQVKLTYRATQRLKVGYNAFYSDFNQDRTFQHDYKYNPGGVPEQFGMSTSQIFSVNHVLSPSTFYEAKINRFYRDVHQYVYENPEAKPKFLVQVMPDTTLGIEGEIFDYTTPEGQLKLADVRSQRLTYHYITDPNGPAGYVHPDSSQAPAGYSYLRSGQNLQHYFRSTAYWVGKFDLTSQLNKVHQFKAGVELRLHELELDSYTLQKKLVEGKSEEVVPFQSWVPPVSNRYHDQYNRKPREVSAYLQDKIELQDLIVNIGLRYDYFNANSVVLSDPKDPNIYDPILDSNRYRNPEAPENERIEYTPEERRAFMHTKVDPKMQVSPRIGLAYPITDRGVIHFSYGHFFQIPEFQYLYDSPDFKFSRGGALEVVGNADLRPQRTVMYEIGLQQQITDDIGVDVTLFYRDVRDWVGVSFPIVTYIPSVSYIPYENKDYSNVRGVTLKLEKRISRGFSARLDYSYQVAEGTYSNPTDAFNAQLAQEEPRLALVPLAWDMNHNVNVQVGFSRKGWTATMVGWFRTGLPYTPSFPYGSAVGTSANTGLRENSARRPGVKGLDLYVNRRFALKSSALNFFITVYNLFDIRDQLSVYGDTGSAKYTTFINSDVVSYDPVRVGTIEEFVKQPAWYTSPRQVQIGMSLGF
jgi:outer membrane receptor for Fe3+-dicitrate